MSMSYAAFCLRCGRNQPCKVQYINAKATVNGVSMQYQKGKALCAVCGGEVYVPEVSDENAKAREDAFTRVSKEVQT